MLRKIQYILYISILIVSVCDVWLYTTRTTQNFSYYVDNPSPLPLPTTRHDTSTDSMASAAKTPAKTLGTSSSSTISTQASSATSTSTTTVAATTTKNTVKKINIKKTTPNPLIGLALFSPANTGLEEAIEEGGDAVPFLQEIYKQPRSIWVFNGNENIREDVHSDITEASNMGTIAVFVIYYAARIPCSDQSTWNDEQTKYLQWVKEFALGSLGQPAIIILEPDALALNECIYSAPLNNNAIAQAVSILKDTNTALRVYIDAGHIDWIAESTMVTRLKRANIYKADGFALNVSNFYSNEDNNEYGEELSDLLGGNVHFVIDTSRNGLGPTEDNEWCNPPERALGVNPTTTTPYDLVDAFLWVKVPGESDEACNGGPSEGVFWKEYAVDLVKNRPTQ